MRALELSMYLFAGIVIGVALATNYHQETPHSEIEKEIRDSELRIEFLKGENKQLKICNDLLESMR